MRRDWPTMGKGMRTGSRTTPQSTAPLPRPRPGSEARQPVLEARMTETLTQAVMGEFLKRLCAVFPGRNVTAASMVYALDAYYNGLKQFDIDAVRAVVEEAINEDLYFPRVA